MKPVIEVNQVRKSFRSQDALRDVSLQVPQGTVFALLGENGAGKTTLIRILMGFLQPDFGNALVLGLNPSTDAEAIRHRVGYVADQPGLYDWMRVGEIGWFASSFYPAGFLDRFRELMHGFEVNVTHKLKNLSKGQRAKVALGLALAHDPELLVLDEPTSGLDPLVRRQFMESMVARAASGRTVLLSSHQLSEVERVADWVAIIHHGQVQVVKPLEDLKTTVVEWMLQCDSSAVALPLFENQPLSETRSGRQIRLIMAEPSEADRQLIADANGVATIEENRLSLEQIFIAYTRGGAQPCHN